MMRMSGTTNESWNVASFDTGTMTVTSYLQENVNEKMEAAIVPTFTGLFL